MIVRPFDKDADLATINDWLATWGQRPLIPAIIPPSGWIIDDHAAIFMYKTDCGLAIIEHLIGNPLRSMAERGIACIKLVDKCIEHAHENNIPQVTFITNHPAVHRLAHRYGCVTDGQQYAVYTWINRRG